MKSVEALRKWVDGLRGIWIDPNDHSIIVTTCDDMPPSIDCVNLREHVNAILDGIEHEVADMVPLPVDADGVPIHIGDWITGDWDAKAKVVAITSEDVYWWEPDGCHWCHAYEVRHHHAPTVEDVLEEFVARWMETHHDDIPALKAEYAARLRLAGDDA